MDFGRVWNTKRAGSFSPQPFGMRYPHHSFRNLALIICKEKKIIQAEYESESALGQIIDDFNLPAYKSFWINSTMSPEKDFSYCFDCIVF